MNYTEIKEFVLIVKALENKFGARVVTNNDNNTVVARIGADTVAQWFGPSGFIADEWVAKVLPKKSTNSRTEVYEALDSERDYQENLAKQAGTPAGEVRPHSLEEFAYYIERYMRVLNEELSTVWTPDRKPTKAALNTLRKITALGVAAMEQHGALKR